MYFYYIENLFKKFVVVKINVVLDHYKACVIILFIFVPNIANNTKEKFIWGVVM